MKEKNFSGTEFPNEFGITKNEFMMMCDLLNGVCPTEGSNELMVPWLVDEIKDGCYFYNLEKKWNVDCDALCTKIKSLDENKVKDLIKEVYKFWNIEPEK